MTPQLIQHVDFSVYITEKAESILSQDGEVFAMLLNMHAKQEPLYHVLTSRFGDKLDIRKAFREDLDKDIYPAVHYCQDSVLLVGAAVSNGYSPV